MREFARKFYFLCFRTLREIFKSMNIDDSGTVKLGEVCICILSYEKSLKKSLTWFSSFLGLGDVTVECSMQ